MQLAQNYNAEKVFKQRGNTRKQLVCLLFTLLSWLHGGEGNSFLFLLKNLCSISIYYGRHLIPNTFHKISLSLFSQTLPLPNPRAMHCEKSVCIRSYSGPYFPAFGLNTERYRVSLRIRSERWEIRTRITLNTDTFYAAM